AHPGDREHAGRHRAAVEPPPVRRVGVLRAGVLRLGHGRVGGSGAHVASPGVACVVAVRSRTRSAASRWSRPGIFTAPLAEAVVTVTVASPKSCSRGPRSLSTVWMRD